MTYELWDTTVGSGLASYDNELEMRSLVQKLLTHHGVTQREELTLVVLDDDGEDVVSFTGQELQDWIVAGPGDSQGLHGSDPDVANHLRIVEGSHNNG